MPAIARRTHIDWDEAYKEHGRELARFEALVESYEKEHHLSFTPGAIELLFVPLVEILESGEKLDFLEVAESFKIVIGVMNKDPSKKERKKKGLERSSLSVIKAFWKSWCNIPPFCDATTERPINTEQQA
jgi:hypothetical protein